MKKVFSILFVAAVLMSFQAKQVAGTTQTPSLQLAVNSSSSETPVNISTGTYVGTIPCADCEGIRIKLTLDENKAGKSKTFLLEQTFMGKPADSNVLRIKGIWLPARGNKQDPNAVIVQLIPEGNYDLLYFLRVSDSAIRMLDSRQQQIQSNHNYTLQKQRH